MRDSLEARLIFYFDNPLYIPFSIQNDINISRHKAGAHTDFGGITFLLQQPGTAGLQVLYPPTKEWIPVPATENSFVVNIGDLLGIWTGGFYRSAVHRVINTGVKHRYSAPFFYNGNMDLRFTPLNGAQGETTVETHIRGKLSATHKQTK
jgi:isopenicillin N synthase-like dioxygenase